jgi:hypothetical protein
MEAAQRTNNGETPGRSDRANKLFFPGGIFFPEPAFDLLMSPAYLHWRCSYKIGSNIDLFAF